MTISITAIAFIITVLTMPSALGGTRDDADSSMPMTAVSNDADYSTEKTPRKPTSARLGSLA